MGDYKRVESEGWSPDAEQRLADWTKHTWDLPHDADEFLRVLGVSSAPLPAQQCALDRFCSLPAAHSIPMELAEELRGRGLSLR